MEKLQILKKIQGILIRNNAFVAWAWCRWLLQVMVVHNTWLVQTSNTILIVVRWANRGSSKVGTMYAGTITFWVFFEDCSRSNRQILMVQQKSNITSQGASASVNERSRKNRFGFQFWLESFVHGEQNVQFAQNFKNLKTI